MNLRGFANDRCESDGSAQRRKVNALPAPADQVWKRFSGGIQPSVVFNPSSKYLPVEPLWWGSSVFCMKIRCDGFEVPLFACAQVFGARSPSVMRPQQRSSLAVEGPNLWSYNSSSELPSSGGPQETHTHTRSQTCIHTFLPAFVRQSVFSCSCSCSLRSCIFQMFLQFHVRIPGRLKPLEVIELPLSAPCDHSPPHPSSRAQPLPCLMSVDGSRSKGHRTVRAWMELWVLTVTNVYGGSEHLQ